jgi:Domain of unknown function (DUF4136)
MMGEATMRSLWPTLFVLSTLCAGSALAQAPGELRRIGDAAKVQVDSDPAVDFTAYKSYAWLPITERPASLADHTRIMQTIESELERKGIAKDTSGKPDVYVGYSASTKKKVKGDSYAQDSSTRGPSDVRTVVEFKRVEEQTVVIEFRDGKTREPVFTGTRREPLQRSDLVAYQLVDAVKTILATYPPRPEPAASPAP